MRHLMIGVLIGSLVGGGTAWAWNHTTRDQLRELNRQIDQQGITQQYERNDRQFRDLLGKPC